MSNRFTFWVVAFAGLFFSACKKETVIEKYEFAKISVSYKKLVGYFPVNVFVNGQDLGMLDIDSADHLQTVVPLADTPVKLSVKKEDGSVLLDTTFVPQMNNNFTLLISDELGIAQFYTPAATQPDEQHMRMQFYHQVIVNGEEHQMVDFKFFTRNGVSGPFTETPYEVKNAAFGKLSTSIDLPVLEPGALYYMRIYDSGTGALLLDLWDDYNDGAIIYTTGGKSIIVNAKTDDYPPDGAFFNRIEVYEW